MVTCTGLFELIQWRLRRPSLAAYDRHLGLAT